MKWEVKVGDESNAIDVRKASDNQWFVAKNDDESQAVSLKPAGPNRWIVEMGNDRHLINAVIKDGTVYVQHRGWNLRFEVSDPRNDFIGGGDADGQGQISTQMPGVIVRTLVAVGDEVSKGQAVIVVEAMKMENELKTPMDGVVKAIHVSDGQAVDSGALLLEIAEGSNEV